MPERADVLIRAARILTPEVLASPGQAAPGFVAVRDGVIAGVGTTGEAADWEAVHCIDLGDGTLAPGFVDAHIHPIIGLEMARGLDLSGIRDADQLRAAFGRHAAEVDGDWVFAWGLDPAVWGGEEPSNRILDGLADGRKVYITLFDGHAALVSDAVLAEAGVRGDETFADASALGLDADGRPNGMLYELAAQALVQPILPVIDFDERVGMLGELLSGMAEAGLVGGQMLDLGSPDTFDLLEALEERGDLGIRLRISPWIMPGFSDADLEEVAGLQGRSGRRWHVRGVKLMIDGTVDNGTAWLFEPDTRGESTASLYLDPSEYRRALGFFHARGIPTTTHAIGDRGIDFVAETIAAQEPNGTQHRIEHIETLPDDVLDRIIASGAAASMQPTHCTHFTLADQSDNWSVRLGPERAHNAWRTKDLRDRGAILALGSDWPIAPYDPRGIVAAAQLRRPAGERDSAPVRVDQALSAAAAVEGYTSEYWRSVGESGGSLVVGARADLTAFADDPLTTDPDAFASTSVLLTVVDGEVVHRNC